MVPRAISVFALVAWLGLPLAALDAMDVKEYANAGIDDPWMIKNFVDHLKIAVASDDAKTLSRMVSYPLAEYEMSKDGYCLFTRIIRTPKQFIAEYSDIFTDDVKAAIRKSPDEHLFSRDSGVMIGNGEVWMNLIGHDITIIAMNRSVKTWH